MKAIGYHRLVEEQVGRKIFSRGIWAAATHDRVRAEPEAERSIEGYAQKEADSR